MIEHDAQRRQQYWTARAYFSISNTTTGEILSEIAIRKRDVVVGKTQEAATRNLKRLERFMADHRDEHAAEHGILLAPGDCFDTPSHFRLGLCRRPATISPRR
jgi:hypothetical protein